MKNTIDTTDTIIFPYGKTHVLSKQMDDGYEIINSTEDLGKIARKRRKEARLTIDTASALANLNPRFFSEFERGKETAEIGKVIKAVKSLGLEVAVRPRNRSPLTPLSNKDVL